MSGAERLVGELERLFRAESIALRARNVQAAAALQKRGAPLIAGLAVGGPVGPALLPRIRGLEQRRQGNLALLNDLRLAWQARWGRLAQARRSLSRLKPYGAETRKVTRFAGRG